MKPNASTVIAGKWISVLMFALLALSWTGWGAEAEPWKFGVFCDTRGSNENVAGKSCVNKQALAAIADKIVVEECELVLVPGDLVNGYWANGGMSYEDQFLIWTEIMAPVYEARIPIYTVRGNHEDDSSPYLPAPDRELWNAYMEAFGNGNPQNGPEGEQGLTYSFEWKNALFVGLDEYVTPHQVNQDWLDLQTPSRQVQHVFAFGHEPAYQVVHADCLAAYSRSRQLFWNSLGALGCRVYFCGHDHLYDRAHVQDLQGNVIWQMLVGSGGAPHHGEPWLPPHADGSVEGDCHQEGGVGLATVTIQGGRATIDWWWWNSDYVLAPRWYLLDTFEYAILESVSISH